MNFKETFDLHLEKGVVHDLTGVLFIQQHGYVPFYVSKDDFSATNSGVQVKGHTNMISWENPQDVKLRAMEDTVVVIGKNSLYMQGVPEVGMTASELGDLLLTAQHEAGESRIYAIQEDGTVVLEDRLINIAEQDTDEITTEEVLGLFGLISVGDAGLENSANVRDDTNKELTDLEAIAFWMDNDTSQGHVITYQNVEHANVEEDTLDETTSPRR